jgi:hypothetical protein
MPAITAFQISPIGAFARDFLPFCLDPSQSGIKLILVVISFDVDYSREVI